MEALSWNEGGRRFVQNIYKYTSNITGSDPNWFQRRRELTAQSEQEGPKGTLFWDLCAYYNHWRDLMKLLDVPEHASHEVKCQAVQKYPHIVDFFFCRIVERAAIHLFIKCLVSDWIWYRYEFKMRVSYHAHVMMKLKLYPDVIDMVTKLYAGNKVTEMLECLIEFGKFQMKENWDFQLKHQNMNQLVLTIRDS